jgi:hypothetical protein
MATTVDLRLASVTACDGVDTRNKDNSGKAAAGTGETTRLGGGDQKLGGQTAALTFLLPPGADEAGTRMSAYWANYLSTADRYIKGDSESFMWTSYGHQQGCNERDIERECRRLGAGEEMLNIYRQFYNAQVVDYMAEPSQLTYDFAMKMLNQYNDELADQTKAVKLIQQAYHVFKSPKPEVSETGTFIADYPKCSCGEDSMFEDGGMCVDCYWTEDARIKKARRNRRQNAIPSEESEPDIDSVVERAISPEHITGWNEFWLQYASSNLRIRIPLNN